MGDASTTGFVAGGVVVIDEPGFNAVADNIRVTDNVISGNGDGITSADLWVDSIGSGHDFDDNHCMTSRPAGLC